MHENNLEYIYNRRIENNNLKIKKLGAKDRFLIGVKLLLFSAGVIVFLNFSRLELKLSFTIFAVLFILFVTSALIHEKILRKIEYYRTLNRINENELRTLKEQFLEEVQGGEEFIDREHFYTSDLDIFGQRSLFHYINRTVTPFGYGKLALSLLKPCSAEEIAEKQEAVKELRGKPDFRHNLQAHGLNSDGSLRYDLGGDAAAGSAAPGAGKKSKQTFFSRYTPLSRGASFEAGGRSAALLQLFDEEFFLLGKKRTVFFIYFLPFITIALFVSLAADVPLGVPFIFMVLQLLANKFCFKRVSRVYSLTGKSSKILKTYARIIKEIEDEYFAAEKLKNLQNDLLVGEQPIVGGMRRTSGDNKASSAIKKLSSLLEWFDVRLSGTMHFILNNTLLWDLHCVYRIEKWRRQSASAVGRWFEVVGEVELLSSFANLYFNNPGWTLPVVRTGDFRLKAADLGHPLILPRERVCNDIDMAGQGSILMVTGPNMAGKSTFLRTLGVNSVLALAGAPVCARGLEISPLRLISSMQSSDSLDKHLSLFYAELQRLKLILDTIKENEKNKNKFPVFFLIDEMLKGTNAVDRQKGSIVLLEQLIEAGANGTVATHDLKLTHLEKSGNKVRNYHFDGEIVDDKLIFDFKLRAGVCESFNALVLMKKIGLAIK